MSATRNSIHDYTTGAARHHHSLYIEDGNFVIQVQNAIFKVHRYFLAKYSEVIKDMLEAPQSGSSRQGTDEEPLVLTGDSAEGWEFLLELLYESLSLLEAETFSGERMLSILPIAHKYGMEKIELAVMKQLKKASTTAGYVKLLLASQIVGCEETCEEAMTGLISGSMVNLEQAHLVGEGATYLIMNAAITDTKAAHTVAVGALQKRLAKLSNMKCRHCPFNRNNWRCYACKKLQDYSVTRGGKKNE